jgi:hypothetical protein
MHNHKKNGSELVIEFLALPRLLRSWMLTEKKLLRRCRFEANEIDKKLNLLQNLIRFFSPFDAVKTLKSLFYPQLSGSLAILCPEVFFFVAS